MRVVIELKRDAIPQVVLNKLYKHTAAADHVRRQHDRAGRRRPRARCRSRRCSTTTSRTRRRSSPGAPSSSSTGPSSRAHILEGYLIALDHLDEVIALIRGADDTEAARSGLMTRFGLTEIQAQAILDLRLRRLTGLERKKIKAEHDELIERIAELRAILADEAAADGR